MAKGTGSKAPAPKSTKNMPPALKKHWEDKNDKKNSDKSGKKKTGK